MNAARYNEYKDTDAIYDSLIFLYCVALDFIEKGSKIRGLEKAVEFTKNHMALGLGALGFHTYLQDHLIPFDSLEAHYFNMRFFRDLDEKSLKASEDLVKLFGECPITKGYGVACSHRTAIAPNLSSALICGGVSNGIEPVYKNAYVQNTASGKMIRVNPSLLKILYDRGLNIEEATKTIINNNGSVQDVIWLSDEEKAVFLTAFELNQFAIIRHAANRQKFITQAQSINTFFSSDAEESYISEVHKYAFLNKSIKSLYYIRSETGVKAITPTCSSCE
jgi:ribonucleoside-diphosphate reductase alpha chain